MYVGIIFGEISAAFSDEDDENPLAKKLEKLEVEPWILAATLGDNRSATSLTINHKSVRTLVEFSEEVAKEMMKGLGLLMKILLIWMSLRSTCLRFKSQWI